MADPLDPRVAAFLSGARDQMNGGGGAAPPASPTAPADPLGDSRVRAFLTGARDQQQQGGGAPAQSQKMPGPGVIPGALQLNAKLAPAVPQGAARPFAPGESVQNPDGSWSSEISVTVMHPELNGGKPTVIPSLWIKDGKPYVAANEDEAAQLAKASGLEFPAFNTINDAEAFSNQREQMWQSVGPSGAAQIPPLWTAPLARAGVAA
jgi:hypothetical protein